MKDGDVGSDGFATELKGGWMERPFIFFARLGAGDVIGRSELFVLHTLSVAIDDRPPNEEVLEVSDDSGRRFTGESGDEDGDGSEREEESVQEAVVVGEDPADSEVCVEVLS